MIRLGLSGDTQQAFEILYKLLPILDYAFEEGNPAGIKNILKNKGICGDHLRLPLIPVSKNLADRIYNYIKNN